MTRSIPWFLVIVLGLLAIGIQGVPCRVQNPPVREEPAWDSPRTRELAQRACFDCHSNQVQTPWYGHIAPFAWLVRDHVEEGRAQLNFSEMDRPREEAHEAGEAVREGEMPPWYYLPLHPEARLTDAEWRQLAAGLEATLGDEDGVSRASDGPPRRLDPDAQDEDGDEDEDEDD